MRLNGASVAQGIRFLLVGGANTAIGYTIILLMMKGFGASPEAANFLGYVLGFVIAFMSHRRITFKDQGDVFPALARFSVTVIIAYGCNMATLLVLIKNTGIPPEICQLAAIMVYTVVSFALSRKFVFVKQAQ